MNTTAATFRNRCVTLILLAGCAGVSAQKNDPWEDSLAQLISATRSRGLPVEALENKIREGRAKGRSTREIHSAVHRRQELLAEIREANNNTVPADYMEELFSLEQQPPAGKSRTTRAKAPVKPPHPVTPSRQMERVILPPPTFEKEKPSETPRGTIAEKPVTPSVKQRNRSMEKAQKRAEKTEKKLEKIEERTERRMKQIEKKVQKRAMKRHGFDK